MHDDDLKLEVQRLGERLDRLEKLLQIAAPTPLPSPSAPPPPVGAEPDWIVPSPPLSAPPQPPAPLAPLVTEIEFEEKCHSFKKLQVDWRKQSSTPSLTISEAPQSTSPISWEMLIGGKWMAWLGALVVLLAVAFAVMVGVKRGWWGRIPLEWRCLGIAAFGFILLLGGKIALRRIGRAASVGLFGAGLGTLYLDAYATSQPFAIVSREVAFILMAAVAVLGFAITLRTRFLTIGVLSIIGGYLTPILLQGQSARDLELLCYLTMLLGISLGLSAASPRDFRPLRYVAFGGQVVIGGMWILAQARTEWQLAIIFASLWWVMIAAEAIIAANRRQSAIGNVLNVLLGTAAYVVAGCWVLRLGPSAVMPAPVTPGTVAFPGLVVANWLGVFAAMIAMLSAVAAFQTGGGLEGLRRVPQTALEKLALAMWAQAGVLFVVAIGLQFRGFAESIGWLAIGMASIEIGRRLPSRGVTIFGLIAGGLALFRVAALDWWITPGMQQPIWTIGAVEISKWSLLMLATIVLMHAAAHRIAPLKEEPQSTFATPPALLAALATMIWFVVCAVQCESLAATAGWLAAITIMLGLHRIGERQRYFEIAQAGLVVTGLRWLLLDAVRPRFENAAEFGAAWPIINWQTGLAAAIVLVACWTCRIARQRPAVSPQAASRTQSAFILIAVFTLIALSFELERALLHTEISSDWRAVWNPLQWRFLWWTGLWSLGGLALILIGRALRFKNVIIAGYGLSALAACAWLTIDTISWRVNEGVVATTVVLNLQFAIGVLAAAILAIALRTAPEPDRGRHDRWIIVTLIAAIGFWAGSLEIDRLFADAPQIRQAALSVYWGCYGGMIVVLGFMKASAPARYAGLGLLSVTAGKVLLIDFAYLDDFPRVISTLVAGLLMIGTSMLYLTLSPRLLEKEA